MEEQTEFSFAELSDRAKQKAIERYAAPDWDWWDSEYEFRKEDGKTKGFIIDDINFNGFYSQGDGACWRGYIDAPKWLELKRDASEGRDYVKYDVLLALAQEGWIEQEARIIYSWRYSHEGSMRIDYADPSADEGLVMTDDTPYKGANVQGLLNEYANEEEFDALSDDMLESARDYAREIYCSLEAEYESYFEEENFADMAEANEWKFDEDGNMI